MSQITAMCDDTDAARSQMAEWMHAVEEFGTTFHAVTSAAEEQVKISASLKSANDKLVSQKPQLNQVVEGAQATMGIFNRFVTAVEEINAGTGIKDPFAGVQ